MKITILDARTLGSDVNLSVFRKFGELRIFETTNPNETIKNIADSDIIITNKVVIDKAVMDSAKNLKLICISATGMNNVDLEYAKEKNITVKNVAGYSTKSVTQHTFAMLFYMIEHLNYYDEYVKSGGWQESSIFTNLDRAFFEISGKKWGIIGLGNIGREVAKIATSFGADVSYFSTSGKNSNSEYSRIELKTLLSESDIISIHAPLNENTKNLINYSNMNLLKDRAVLINVGRGGIISETDLSKFIDEREIFVGLDVLEIEPIRSYNPLNMIKHKERLFITPHIAWSSFEAREKLIELIVKNIENFLGE